LITLFLHVFDSFSVIYIEIYIKTNKKKYESIKSLLKEKVQMTIASI